MSFLFHLSTKCLEAYTGWKFGIDAFTWTDNKILRIQFFSAYGYKYNFVFSSCNLNTFILFKQKPKKLTRSQTGVSISAPCDGSTNTGYLNISASNDIFVQSFTWLANWAFFSILSYKFPENFVSASSITWNKCSLSDLIFLAREGESPDKYRNAVQLCELTKFLCYGEQMRSHQQEPGKTPIPFCQRVFLLFLLQMGCQGLDIFEMGNYLA